MIYGELTGKTDFGECLIAAAKIVVEDNISDYYDDLRAVKAGSLLEELDDDSTKAWFRGLLETSVAYMMLARCGNITMTLDYYTHVDACSVKAEMERLAA